MKTLRTIRKTYTLFLLGGLLTLAACNKSGKTANMQIRMKDNPIDLQEVNIEILEVKVHITDKEKDSTDESSWISLPTNAGVYNLLLLQDGITDTLVDDSEIPAGHLNQMRLILGENNTIMVDSTIFDLDTPSAQSSGLKFKIKEEVKPDETYDLLFDFDAEQSIVEKGNGGYSLKPVLKLEKMNKK